MSLFRSLSPTTRAALILLCTLVVMLRVGEAHMHLCLDGSEPPATLHLANDSGMHHVQDEHADHATEVKHTDVDVALAGDALMKKASSGFDFLALIGGMVLILYALSRDLRILPTVDFLLPFTAHRAHLRPLLRGPPL